MGKVTALMMDVITEASGHQVVPNAVSVCITPCAPSPVPIPYPVIASVSEGITDPPLRTKVSGEKFATTGSVLKACHGNEAGTLKETCSLNTGGPVFIIMGAPTVISELGMMGITGALCISNKAITVGAGGSASDASGTGGPAGGGGGGGAGGPGPDGPGGASNGGGGGGGSNSGASASSPSPGGRGAGADGPPGTASGPAEQHQCQNGHPVDMATGYVVDQALDFELPGLIPFVFHRRYSSGRHHNTRASFGQGWAHGWEMNVGESDRSIVLRDSQGRSICFEKIAIGEKTFHRGERMELTRLASDRYEIFHLTNRLTYRFEAFADGGISELRHVRDGFDNRIELQYEAGRLVSARDTAGRDILFSWQGARIRRVDVRLGGASELAYDYDYNERGLLIAVTDPLGHSETFDYDGQGRMVATTLKTGVTFRYEYEPDTGRCKRTWGPKGLYDLVFSADLANHLTFADGEEPRTYTIDDHEHVTREATPSGAVLEERAYDEDGYLIAEVNGAGEGTQYWYDARGNLIRQVDATGAATTWDYDERDLPIRRTTPDGLITSHTYGRNGELVRTDSHKGDHTSYTYDSFGRLTRIDEQGAVADLYEYDARHCCISETDALGRRSVYGHDALGRTTERTDPVGRVQRLVRDRMGRVSSMLLPDGARVALHHDALGNLTEETDPLGRTTSFWRSGLGVITQIKDPTGKVWNLKYTSNERLTQITNASGERYDLRYDEAGRVVYERTFDGRELRYERDAAGRVARIVHADESWRSFGYDRCGRVLVDATSEGSTVRFKRDKLGRVVSGLIEEEGWRHETRFERDESGNIVAEQQGDLGLRYQVDRKGRVVARTLPDGKRTDYLYDAVGDLIGIAHCGSTFDIEIDSARQPTAIAPRDGSFSLRTEYDATGRPKRQNTWRPGAELERPNELDRSFRYDRNGQLKTALEKRLGESRFTYDDAGRLASSDVSSAFSESSLLFEYGQSGALIGVKERQAREITKHAWKTLPGNVISATNGFKFQSDARGRRLGARDLANPDDGTSVTQYTWDGRDRLVEVRASSQRRVVYHYDAFGRKVEKLVFQTDQLTPAGRVAYAWSGNALAQQISKRNESSSFVYRPGTFVPLLHEQANEVFLCVSDHLGATRELLDGAGTLAWSGQFGPWGESLGEYVDEKRRLAGKVVRSPFRLLGQIFDEDVGLSWTHHRVFDAHSKRWLSPDPIGLAGGMDAFGFDGAPTVVVDPFGLATGDPHDHGAGSGQQRMTPEQREAQQALDKNREFRDWFHREYKRTEGTGDGDRHNPDMTPAQVADAYSEWKEQQGSGGSGGGKGRGRRQRGGGRGGGDY